jgi:hypothetical protein
MFVRPLLIIGISSVTLLISMIIDTICSVLTYPIVKFLVQVPITVMIVNMLRDITIHLTATHFHFTETDIDGMFFFTAPLAALGSPLLFASTKEVFSIYQ